MRKFVAATLGALCVLAALGSPASADQDNSQRWVVLTRPGGPTEVIATGTVNAIGTVVDTLYLFPDGTFDNYAIQSFPAGKLYYHGQGTYELSVNARTCIGKGDVVGPFEITGGEGAYAGATGGGVALISLTFFFERTRTGCSQVPQRIYAVARAFGTLEIP